MEPTNSAEPANSTELTNSAKLTEVNQGYSEHIKSLRPIDDEFAYVLFRNNPVLIKHTLDLILNQSGTLHVSDINIARVYAQHEIRHNDSRYVRLDILAKDMNGRIFNLEFQRASSGADVLRARFYMGMIDSDTLKSQDKYKNLEETYVIFITEKDYFKENKPVYYSTVMDMDTGKSRNFKEYFVYVNGAYKGDDAIGRFIHDLTCRNACDMQDPVMREWVSYFKLTVQGQRIMDDELSDFARAYIEVGRKEGREEGREEGRQEGREEGKLELVIDMLLDGLPLERIARITKFSLEKIKQMQVQVQAQPIA